MIIVFDLMQEPLIRNALGAARLEPIQSVPMRDTLLEPVSLFHVQDYGDWFMVRAANMKITVERATGKIVNVSGGGCPDVPYLAALLTGQCIGEAEEPRVKGQTLCSYSLHRPAFRTARDTRPARNRIADVRNAWGGASHGTARRGHRERRREQEALQPPCGLPQPVRGSGHHVSLPVPRP